MKCRRNSLKKVVATCWIASQTFFEDSGRTRKQVAKKLKQMKLITDIRQVTKKPLKTKGAPWTDEEIETLTRLYKEFQDAVDPVKLIIHQLPVKRQKKRIVEKIMELKLCNDVKKLMKKKVRRGMKEGDAGYLEKASESDSAMEDSSSDDDEADNNQASDGGNDNNSGGESFDETELKSTLEAISKDENLLPALKWLKTCLNDEKEDREEDDENIADMPLVPILEECTSAMELPDFVKLLSVTKLSAPNDQEQYWRIPATLSANALAEKCTFIQKIIDMEIDDINLEAILGKSGKKTFSKTKKKEKRGPNKWMPMRRAVDSEVAQRISEAAGVKEKVESPPSKSGKKKPGKSNKKPEKSGGNKKTPNRRKIVKNYSSSDEENNPKEKRSDSVGDDDGNKKTPNRRKIVKYDSSSDEENNAIEKGSDSGGDDGNNASSEQQVNSPVFKSSKFIENSSSDDEENQTPSSGKTRENKAKRRVMNSSSSDEAVDDPSPMPSQNEKSEQSNKLNGKEQKKKKPFEDSSSDDEDDLTPNLTNSQNKVKRKVMDSSSSDEEKAKDKESSSEVVETEKSAASKNRLASSSSDEGVDDPMPIQRPPSDDENNMSINENDESNRCSSRNSSLSSRSRSRSRSRSMSNSPMLMVDATMTPNKVVNGSSASNTPKRLRSSPSPAKSQKKPRKASKIVDTSSEDE